MTAFDAATFQAIASFGVHTDARGAEARAAILAPEMKLDYTTYRGGEPAVVRAADLTEARPSGD